MTCTGTATEHSTQHSTAHDECLLHMSQGQPLPPLTCTHIPADMTFCFFISAVTFGSPLKLLYSAVDFTDAVKGEQRCRTFVQSCCSDAMSAGQVTSCERACRLQVAKASSLRLGTPNACSPPAPSLLQAASWPWRAMPRCRHASTGAWGRA